MSGKIIKRNNIWDRYYPVSDAQRYALIYARRFGWPVIPCERDGSPVSLNGIEDATTNLDKIQVIWGFPEAVNVAVVTGEKSGLVAVHAMDLQGIRTLERLQFIYGRLPDTIKLMIPDGGYYLIYQRSLNEMIGNVRREPNDGLNIVDKDGFVILPRVRHRSTAYLHWEKGCSPYERSVAEALDWVMAIANSG